MYSFLGSFHLPSLSQDTLVNSFVSVAEYVEYDFIYAGLMTVKPFSYCLYCDLCGFLGREAEHPCGDAAKGDAFKTVLFGTNHNVAVTGCQLFLLGFCRDAVGDDGADGVDDVLARQIVRLGDFGPPRRFRMSLLQHQPVTFLAQLHARRGMDGVVDASVQRVETAQHLRIGGVDDGVHAETGDVALP